MASEDLNALYKKARGFVFSIMRADTAVKQKITRILLWPIVLTYVLAPFITSAAPKPSLALPAICEQLPANDKKIGYAPAPPTPAAALEKNKLESAAPKRKMQHGDMVTW